MNITIDIDEVLAQFLQGVIDYHNHTYKTELTTTQFNSYYFWETWGGTREQAIKKVADFSKSDFYTSIKPLEGAQEAIQTLKQNHSLFVVTARPETMEKQTRRWLDKHFPNAFQDVVFTNHWADDCETISKGDVCNKFNADIHIEDNIDYAKECINGKRRIFLMNQPWNQDDNLPPDITRLNSWKEILQMI